MLMKSNLIILTTLALSVSLSAQQTSPKVGVINIQTAIIGTKDGQKASQELQTKFAPKQKDVQSRQAEITQSEDQLRKGGSLMNEEKRNQLVRDIDEKKKRLQRDVQDDQEALQQEQQRVLQGLGQRMMAVIDKYAKDNGYTLIIDIGSPNTPVLYAATGIEITPDIISLYDKTTSNGSPASTSNTPGASTTPKSSPKPGTTSRSRPK